MPDLIEHAHHFAIDTRVTREGAVVVVRGQADLHTAPELRSVLGGLVDAGQKKLVIDLSKTTFIDSMMLGVLLGALKRLTGVGGQLVIVCPDSQIRRVFEITSLDRVLRLVDSLDDASAPRDAVQELGDGTAVDTARKRHEQQRLRETLERKGAIDPESGEADLELDRRKRYAPPDDAPFSAG